MQTFKEFQADLNANYVNKVDVLDTNDVLVNTMTVAINELDAVAKSLPKGYSFVVKTVKKAITQ